MKQSVSDALLLVMLFYSKQNRNESLKTMRDVWLQAGQEASSKIKADCLTVAWYLITGNLSMISK